MAGFFIFQLVAPGPGHFTYINQTLKPHYIPLNPTCIINPSPAPDQITGNLCHFKPDCFGSASILARSGNGPEPSQKSLDPDANCEFKATCFSCKSNNKNLFEFLNLLLRCLIIANFF